MRKLLSQIALLFFILMSCSLSHAQLSVTQNGNAQQLGNNLAGANIAVTNATISGNPSQYGTFQFNGTGLGLNSGVILSTGDIFDAVGPNNQGDVGTDFFGPGDPDLSALAGFGTNDAVVFEFDFEVQGDEIEFNFVFLSEEYNEFVGTQFNDVFAFYISGPGISGQENLAVVPGTSSPVTINSINNGSFWQFYNDNTVANQVNIQFDGFTTLMTAQKSGLQQCGVYTLSLRIADGADGAYDSGVLLQENSLVQTNVSATSYTYSGNSIALEGCIDASFTFNLDTPAVSPVEIPIGIGGSALNGVDYNYIDSIITIPVGQSSATVIVEALSDGLTEGQESVELYFYSNPCAAPDTVTLFIDDTNPLQFELNGTDLSCHEDASGVVDVQITGGSPPYLVTLTDSATGQSNTYQAATLPVTGLDAATYIVSVSDLYGCEAEALVIGGNFNAGQTFLPDGTGVSYTSSINISGFNNGQTINNVSQINSICATMEHSYANDLTIVLEAPNGVQVMLKNVGTTGGNVNSCNLGEPVASGPVDQWNSAIPDPGVGYQYCWNNNPVYPSMNDMIQVNAPGPPPQYTYTTLFGNTYTDYYLPAGSYESVQPLSGFIGAPMNGTWTLIVTDNYALDNGYIFDWNISLVGDLPDSAITLLQPDSLTFATTLTNPACGASNGAIDLSVTGEHSPFTFNWSNGATTEDISSLSAGSYTVSVTDTTSCVYTYTVNLSNNGSVSLTANITNELCVGSNNGAIDISTNGGTAPFNYSWSNTASSEDVTSLAPGTYSVTVTDAGACLGIYSYSVAAAVPIISSALVTNEECGDREGIVDLSIQGGQAPFSFSWSTGETTEDIDNLQQGTYVVQITDANGCTANDTFTVINLVGNCVPNCDLVINSFTVNDENCGQANGNIDITTFTTNGPSTYLWSNGETTEDINALAAGNYSVSITDLEGCFVEQSFTLVNQANGLSIDALNQTNEFCGNAQGSISAQVSGGAQPYSYQWSNGATTATISGLTAGTYALTVTDANGCAFLDQAELVNNAGTLTQTFGNAADETCGNSQGSIDINFSGGQQPYSYQWSNGAISEDIFGLSAGSYTCTVTDNAGCAIVTQTYVVNNNAAGLAISFVDLDNEVCNNDAGAIELFVSGGTAPLNYLWNTGATTAAIANLDAGTYSATVTDANGCPVQTGNLTLVNESGTLSLDGITVLDENCSNGIGSIDLEISGGTAPVSYSWNTGSSSQDITNLSAGNYSATITDVNGCEVQAVATVNNNPGVLSIDNFLLTEDSCSQSLGAITTLISGATAPATYTWSNGATTQNQSNLPAGNYSLTVVDAQGCSSTASTSIPNNTGNFSLDNVALVNEVCGNGGGSIDLSTTGDDILYLWSNNETDQDLFNLSAGTYSCTMTDAYGCVIYAGPYTINNSAASLSASNNVITDESCGNAAGAIDLNVTGGLAPYTYSWSNGATTEDLSGIAAGSYSCTITDANGCAAVITESIQNNAANLVLDNVSISDELCSNSAGAIDISPIGGTSPYSFSWSNGATTEDLTGLNAGNYELTLTDVNGCLITAMYTVLNNAGNFQLSSISTQDEICGNAQGAVAVSVSGASFPIVYNWSNGQTSQNISNLSAGVYAATATDNNGCVLQYSTIVQNDPGSLGVDSVAIDNELCGASDGQIDLSIGGGTAPYSYQWSNGATTEDISNLDGGIYNCFITDAAGCQTSYSGTVADLGGNFTISNIQTTNDLCDQEIGSISLNPIGGTAPYNYSWVTQIPDTCCTFYLEMNDQAGNGWGNQSINLIVNGVVTGPYTCVGSQTIESFTFCNGDVVAIEYNTGGFGGNGNWYYFRSNSDTLFADGPGAQPGIVFSDTIACPTSPGNTPTITGLGANTYQLTVTDQNGCVATTSVEITNSLGGLAIDNAVLADEFCSQSDGSIDLTVSGQAPAVTWSNGATSTDLLNVPAGTYIAIVADPNGCTISDTFTIVNQTNGLAISTSNTVDETCSNAQGAIDLTVTGGAAPYSYNWSNGATTEDIINLSTGNYEVTVVDAAGCTFLSNFAIANIANGMVASSTNSDDFCGNGFGTIDLTVTGGNTPLSFLWSNGSTAQDLSAVNAGVYTVTITDNSGCTLIHTDTVNYSAGNLVVAGSFVNDEFCSDQQGEIFLNVNGGSNPITYQWSNGATGDFVFGLSAGLYTVTITDNSGCEIVDSFTIINEAFFEVTDTIITPAVCGNNQGAINLSISGTTGLSYLWSTGATTEDVNNLLPGTYTVTITAGGPGGGCFISQDYTIPNDNGGIALDSLGVVNETCAQANGELLIVPQGGTAPYSYNWSTGATTAGISNLTAGLYTVQVLDANGCELNDTVSLLNNTFGFGIQAASTNDELCGDASGAVNITVSGGTTPYSFVWDDALSSTTEDLSGLTAGTYSVTITDNTGCAVSQSYSISNVINNIVANATSTDDLCNNSLGFIDLTASGGQAPYTYQWNNGLNTEDLSSVLAGTYIVTITDAAGCTVADSFTVGNQVVPIVVNNADISNATCLACNDGAIDLTLDPAGAPYTFSWNNGASTEDLVNVSAGTYNVLVTNNAGCSESFTYVISITTEINYRENWKILLYPNPTQGLLNINFGQQPEEVVQLQLFNSLGQRVWAQNYAAGTLNQLLQLNLDIDYSGSFMLQIRIGDQLMTKRIELIKN